MKTLDNKTIGEIVLMVLEDEGEELSDLLSDYTIYVHEITNQRIAELTVEHLRIKDDEDFKNLMKVYHGLIGNYTFGEYHPFSTTAQFLVEGFRIYSLGLGQ